MPRRKDISPEEWVRRVDYLRHAFADVQEAVNRYRDFLLAKAQEAGQHRIIDDRLQPPDPKEMATWHARAIALEDQWLEALACLAHRMGLPNMYGPDGRPRAAPRTIWGPVTPEDVRRVFNELRAAHEAGNREELRLWLLTSYHIPQDALNAMPDPERTALEAKVQDEATRYAQAKETQSAFTWGHLVKGYAARLNISVSTLERMVNPQRGSSKR